MRFILRPPGFGGDNGWKWELQEPLWREAGGIYIPIARQLGSCATRPHAIARAHQAAQVISRAYVVDWDGQGWPFAPQARPPAFEYPADMPCRFLINGHPKNPGWSGKGRYAWWTLQLRVAGEYQSLGLMAESFSYGPDEVAAKASGVMERISLVAIVDQDETLIAQFCWHNPDGRDGGGELRVRPTADRRAARSEWKRLGISRRVEFGLG